MLLEVYKATWGQEILFVISEHSSLPSDLPLSLVPTQPHHFLDSLLPVVSVTSGRILKLKELIQFGFIMVSRARVRSLLGAVFMLSTTEIIGLVRHSLALQVTTVSSAKCRAQANHHQV